MADDRFRVEQEESGISRRKFLRRAGMGAAAAAWTVPTMQIINMAGAAAGDEGGGVGTSVTPTTRPPDPCAEIVTLRLRAVGGDGWFFTDQPGTDDCLEGQLVPAPTGVTVEESNGVVTVAHELPLCAIVAGAHKTPAGACVPATVASDGSYAMFDGTQTNGIVAVEVVVECCIPAELP